MSEKKTLAEIINGVNGAIAQATVDGRDIRVEYHHNTDRAYDFSLWYDPKRKEPEDIHFSSGLTQVEWAVDYDDMAANIEAEFGKLIIVEGEGEPFLVDQAIWVMIW